MNVYEERYEKLIKKWKSTDARGIVVERHHIVPKSVGGPDDEANIVSLPPAQHYYAHYLLALSAITKDASSKEAALLSWAWDNMSNFSRFKKTGMPKYLKKNAEEYEKIRTARLSVYENPDWKKKHKEGLEKYRSDPFVMEKISKSMRERVLSPEWQEANRQRVKSEEWKKRQKDGLRSVMSTNEYKEKQRAGCIERNKNEEYRKKRSEAIKAAMARPEVRERVRKAAQIRSSKKSWKDNRVDLMKRLHEDATIKKKRSAGLSVAMRKRLSDPAVLSATQERMRKVQKSEAAKSATQMVRKSTEYAKMRSNAAKKAIATKLDRYGTYFLPKKEKGDQR